MTSYQKSDSIKIYTATPHPLYNLVTYQENRA